MLRSSIYLRGNCFAFVRGDWNIRFITQQGDPNAAAMVGGMIYRYAGADVLFIPSYWVVSTGTTVDQYFHPGCTSFPRNLVHIYLVRVIFCSRPIKTNTLTPPKARSTHDPTAPAVHVHSKILTTATHVSTSSYVQNSKILFRKEEIHSHQAHKKRETRNNRNTFVFTMASSPAFFTLRYN